MGQATKSIELAKPVQQLLHGVRALLRKYVLTQIGLMVVCWLLLLFWLGGLIDYLPVRAGASETPRWVRVGMLTLMAIGTAWALLGWGVPRLFARVRDRSIALLIERHYPELKNSLVTAVELSDGHRDDELSNPVAHENMLRRVHQSLGAHVERVEPSTLFNWQPLWATATAAVFGLVLTLLAAISMPEWLALWSQRLFALSETPWPRQAELRVDGVSLPLPPFSGQLAVEKAELSFDQGLARVPTGAEVRLLVSASAEEKVVPDFCTLYYRSDDGGQGRANMRRVGKVQSGWQQFSLEGPPLDGISANMRLDVVGLDARLRNLKLETVAPVVIGEMLIEVAYPEYLKSSLGRPDSEQLVYRSGVQIPEGSRIALLGDASSSLKELEYVRREKTASPESDSDESASAVERLVIGSREFKIPLGMLTDDLLVEIRLIDEFGLPSESVPRYLVGMREDAVPDVTSELVGIGNAITPDARLPIRGQVEDDYGVKAVQAELMRSDDVEFSVPLQLDVSDLTSEVDLRSLAEKGSFVIEPGDTLGILVTASDHYDLDGMTHLGQGQLQQLSVVTADELLVILDRRELELRKRLELIIAELQQLREVLFLIREDSLMLASAGDSPSSASGETEVERIGRMQLFRSQQVVLQGEKSEQELVGIADRIDNVRLQLLNNRIDSYDRQERLEQRIHTPLLELLDNEYKSFSVALIETRSKAESAEVATVTLQAAERLDIVLAKLDAIMQNMKEIESFNEIVDLVRGMLDDQDGLIEETEKAQREKILDLLK